MPTGSGKTIVNARFLEGIYKMFPFQKVMLLVYGGLVQQDYG